ncbi:MAG: hypothetical protein PT120_10070 [Aphanizomenon gracile PMC649.10]|nr:hypothetical protein [Aphanizomenon gracile PMC649.10]
MSKELSSLLLIAITPILILSCVNDKPLPSPVTEITSSPSPPEETPSPSNNPQEFSSIPFNSSECTTYSKSTKTKLGVSEGRIVPDGELLSEFTFFPDKRVRNRFYAFGTLSLEGTGTAQFYEGNKEIFTVTGSQVGLKTGEVSKLYYTFTWFSRDGKIQLVDQYGDVYTKSDDSSC